MLKSQIDIDSKVNQIFAKTLVTQKILNNSKSPIELKIYIDKYFDKNLFSSFEAQIGNSIKAKSKVIKTEKAEEKYTDSISSGNAAIYTTIDPDNKNLIIVHIGNIPPKEQLTFISEFIQNTESSNNSYEYELFRNIPRIKDKFETDIQNDNIKGTLEIKTKNKIKNIDKKFLSDKLIIIEEKQNNEKNLFIMKYKYKKKTNKNYKKLNYIESSKLIFELNSNINLFYQNSLKNKDEQSFIFNYKLTESKNTSSNTQKSKYSSKLNPALFIFLIDQSGSMAGSPIKVASKALLLFLQSLPAGSYYQIIGFGYNYKLYDRIPKEYKQQNIQESIKIAEGLKGDMGGTNIYDPLKYIYNSNSDYQNILLPKNIFLLTDGEIDDKKETLDLIEKNSNEFSVFSFGIGNDFDEDLIKNAGIVGKGNYSFCKKIEGLSQVIISNLNNICTSYINNFNITSDLDNITLFNTNNTFQVMKENIIYRFGYITKEKISNKTIKFTVKYKQNKEDIIKTLELEPIELPSGEELSKLIVYKNIWNNKSEEEKIKLALKYQLFIEGTSLFTQVNLDKKITEVMKHEEIKKKGKKNEDYLDNKIKEQEIRLENYEKKINELELEAKEKLKVGDKEGAKRIIKEQFNLAEKIKHIEGAIAQMEEQKMMIGNTLQMKDIMSCIKSNNLAIKEASKGMSVEELEMMKDNMELNAGQEELNDFFRDNDNNDDEDDINYKLEKLEEEMYKENIFSKPMPENMKIKIEKEKEEDEFDLNQFLALDYNDFNENKDVEKEEKKEEKKEEIIEEKELKLDLKNKDDVMKIINSQDFVSGFWDINDKTKNLKNKYEKEFKLLKELKNVDDIIAMTIIVIYFINKEHKELLDELVMILQKAQMYVQDKTREEYEDIIKKAGIK